VSRAEKSCACGISGEICYYVAFRPRSEKAISNWFSEAAREAALRGYTAHGLRKTRAIALAEAGATHHQIGAWTGHDSLKEIEELHPGRPPEAANPGDKSGTENGNRSDGSFQSLKKFIKNQACFREVADSGGFEPPTS
jgi:hypothetical protein